MASGSFYKAISRYNYKLIVEWTSTATTSSNSSTVKAKIKLYCPYDLYISARSDNAIVINGVTYTYSSPAISTSGGTFTLATITSNAISHNADGSKSTTITCNFSLRATIDGTYYGTVTASSTVTLDNIPRAATLTAAPNFNDEQNPKITYSNPAGNAVSSLQACISLTGDNPDVPYRDVSKTGTSYTFSLTDAERKTLRSATTSNSRTVYFYLKTVIGNNTYHNKLSKTFSIINGNPTLSPTVKDIGSVSITLTGDANNKLIKDYNVMSVSAGATALKEATIKSYKISCGGKSITTESGTLDFVDSGTFTFSVTDSRGNTTTQKVTKTLIPYVKLTCNLSANAPTTAGDMTFTVKGNYFNGSFGAVTNTLTVQYRYKTNSGSYGAWTNLTPTISNNTYTANGSLTGLDYQNSYTIQARALDAIYDENPRVSAEKKVKTTPVFDWGENDFNFNVPVSHQNNITFPTGRYGAYGINTNGDKVSAFETCTARNEVLVGYGNYKNSLGSTNICGHQVRFYHNDGIYINGRKYGENKVLWSGAYYMNASHTATLSQPISEQPNGIIIVFSLYRNGAAEDASVCSFFVSKKEVELMPDAGHTFFCLINSGFSVMGAKYLNISDTQITGNNTNSTNGTSNNITFNNKSFVLRYVIGV